MHFWLNRHHNQVLNVVLTTAWIGLWRKNIINIFRTTFLFWRTGPGLYTGRLARLHSSSSYSYSACFYILSNFPLLLLFSSRKEFRNVCSEDKGQCIWLGGGLFQWLSNPGVFHCGLVYKIRICFRFFPIMSFDPPYQGVQNLHFCIISHFWKVL